MQQLGKQVFFLYSGGIKSILLEWYKKGLGRCRVSIFAGLLNSVLYDGSSYSSQEGLGDVPLQKD